MKIGDKIWVWSTDSNLKIIPATVVDIARYDSGTQERRIYFDDDIDHYGYTANLGESEVFRSERACLVAALESLWRGIATTEQHTKLLRGLVEEGEARLAQIDGDEDEV